MSKLQAALTNPERAQGVVARRLIFCEHAECNHTAQLIKFCSRCHGYFARCCNHADRDEVCHHYKLVFTDGACLSNGQRDATAGIGIAVGVFGEDWDQWAIPIDDSVDAYHKRSSQRAELLAALKGLFKLRDKELEVYEYSLDEHNTLQHLRGLRRPAWIITTDSEYVVKGMTEWLPVWKVND
ncbi:hypothetical protein SCP_0114040 [Sparassis crispa]|uniref:ribonuclease H n=1 Tax=Sparassis crispa TaxID=139825 RepID=A0A401G8M0_9APHY|nr:hypothetical protein SCP_0114040 [Sparassis crispa]GBE78515.1 hypothetical protein SCP_0114040 [Sparassis crispa]